MTLAIIIVAAGIAAVIILFLIRRKWLGDISGRVFAITDRTILPSGLAVWVEDGASLNDAEIAAIENGLERCFEKARRAGYDRPLRLSDYIVAIVGDAVRSPESQIWSYKLPAGDYAGSEWDLGGYILAAGQMIAVGEPYGNIIAVPEHKGTDLEQLAEVVMYEAEHIILAYCDGEKFEATKIHGSGQGHPLF